MHYLVTEKGGELVGVVGYVVMADMLREELQFVVESVYVRPEHRRRGLFSKMYGRLVELAKAHPLAGGVTLYVEKENAGAKKTYEKMGMADSGVPLFERDLTLL